MRVCGRDDRGAVTAFATVFTVAVFFVFGLVFDGGRMLAAQRQADNEAAGAARAAAQAIDTDRLRAGETTNLLNFGQAQQYLCDYAAQVDRGCGDFDLTATRGGTAVAVTTEIDVNLLVLPGASRSIEGQGTACTEIGVDEPIVVCG